MYLLETGNKHPPYINTAPKKPLLIKFFCQAYNIKV